jgi:hypothetical protein
LQVQFTFLVVIYVKSYCKLKNCLTKNYLIHTNIYQYSPVLWDNHIYFELISYISNISRSIISTLFFSNISLANCMPVIFSIVVNRFLLCKSSSGSSALNSLVIFRVFIVCLIFLLNHNFLHVHTKQIRINIFDV